LTQNPERSEGPRCASRAVYLTGRGFHYPQTHQWQRHWTTAPRCARGSGSATVRF